MQLKFLTLALLLNNSLVEGKYWKTGTPHGMKNEVPTPPPKDSGMIRVAVAGDSISDDTVNPF